MDNDANTPEKLSLVRWRSPHWTDDFTIGRGFCLWFENCYHPHWASRYYECRKTAAWSSSERWQKELGAVRSTSWRKPRRTRRAIKTTVNKMSTIWIALFINQSEAHPSFRYYYAGRYALWNIIGCCSYTSLWGLMQLVWTASLRWLSLASRYNNSSQTDPQQHNERWNVNIPSTSHELLL